MELVYLSLPYEIWIPVTASDGGAFQPAAEQNHHWSKQVEADGEVAHKGLRKQVVVQAKHERSLNLSLSLNLP
jgi:hypothetical protein